MTFFTVTVMNFVTCLFVHYSDVLIENAVPEIMAEIRDASDVWFQIGVELKLRMETLEAIRQRNPSNEDCLRELLREWLKNPDLQHTWAELIRALRSKTVRKLDLATELERKHCPDPGRLTHVNP